MPGMKRGQRAAWALLAVFCALIVSCAGCGLAGRFGIPRSSEDGKPAPEPVVLHYSSFLLDAAQAGKVYYEAIADFEKRYPNIKIEANFIQSNNYTAGIKIRLLGGEPLDVFDTWSPSLFEEFRKLRPDVYLDLSGSPFLDDFYPSSLKPVEVDGKVYGVPEVMHSDGLIYNQTMFDRLGLQVPRTWDELLELCETLKREGIIPIAADGEWSNAQFFWGSIMSNNGADAEWTKKLESGQIKIDHPYFVDAISKHKLLIDRGYVPKNWTSLKHEQAKDLIGNGSAAMLITGTWDLLTIKERDPSQDIRFMVIPGSTRTVPNINVGSYRVINSQTKHPEEAKLFVAFMNGRASQEKLARGANAIPSTISSSQGWNESTSSIAAAVTQKEATLYWPHTISTESLQVKILEGVNHYLAGAPLKTALDDIQKAIDEARKSSLP
ncbi:ABC transporter substrate-binding protein [Paenibacillus pasadenensis]|uniref:Multiple sugar ABC transporter, substrate-binding protein n=2 Tax=Paenibacillus pasadenensis TaxID=217090 RepID=A0A2N5N4X9_9BACL|nr:Multiple sugar ABC transporter, substrate-binding protein [Paenibacillus pasadenensis]